MKKVIIYIQVVIAFTWMILLLPSCKKEFLEVTPKGLLIAQTVADYNLLMSNLDLVNINANAQVPMGDEVAAIEPYFSGAALRTQRLFRWDDIIYEPEELAREMTVPMQNIYLFNKVITEVPNATDGTDQKKRSLIAEAKAGRAWTYFLLINLYAKPYNPATAATDPGFPIVKEANLTATRFERASVQQVYDLIVNDLTTAIPDLPVQTTHYLRMSKAGAEAILGKVYVFMQKFNDALPQLDGALTDIKNSAVPINLYDYNAGFATGGFFLPINASFGPTYPNIPNNQENIFGKQVSNDWTNSSELVIGKKTISLFDSSDLRLKFFSPNARNNGPVYPNALMRKMGYSAIMVGANLPDIYLLRAECRARLNDLTGAKTDVETLRVKRMPASKASVPADTASQQFPMLQFILDERIREFASQGYRWFDMRRLSVDPLFGRTNYTHVVYAATGAIAETFTLRPERLVLRFPQQTIDQNPDMKNNP